MDIHNHIGKPLVEEVSDDEFMLHAHSRHALLGNAYSHHQNYHLRNDMNCSVIEEGFS